METVIRFFFNTYTMTQSCQSHTLRNLLIFMVILAIAGTILGTGGYYVESSQKTAEVPPENLGLNCRETCHSSSYGGQNCKIICS